jgi:hypothetical protein
MSEVAYLMGWDYTNGVPRKVAINALGELKISSLVNLENLDVLLSSRASESTLSSIKSKTDNLDVLLSSRASESTLSSIKSKTDNLDVLLSSRLADNKFPSAVALSDSLGNPTTTIVGNALLGFDGTYWRRLQCDTSGRLKVSF